MRQAEGRVFWLLVEKSLLPPCPRCFIIVSCHQREAWNEKKKRIRSPLASRNMQTTTEISCLIKANSACLDEISIKWMERKLKRYQRRHFALSPTHLMIITKSTVHAPVYRGSIVSLATFFSLPFGARSLFLPVRSNFRVGFSFIWAPFRGRDRGRERGVMNGIFWR